MVKEYFDEISKLIKEKDEISLCELDKKGISRQTLRYNLRKLIREGIIKSYVKLSDDKSMEFPKDNEIFFTFVQSHFDSPQDILELIENMCSNNKPKSENAFNIFIKLCIQRHLGERFYAKDDKGNYLFKKNGKRLVAFIYQEESEELHQKQIHAKAQKMAYALMSGMFPELKEKVAFKLTYIADSCDEMKKVKDITFSL